MLFVSWPHWGTANVVNLIYNICPSGPAASNNGNLVAYNEYLGAPGASAYTAFSQPSTAGGTIAYDGVNRLTNISDTGGWSRTFAYDAFGNMSVAAATGMLPLNNNTPQGSNPAAIYNTNNQVVGQSYTAVGNLTTILSAPNIGLAYDAENRQISAGGYSYGYDGNGRRVTKTFGGNTTVYVYDAAGELAAEYNTSAVQTAPACVTCYLSYDYLGSVRLVTNGANGGVVSRHDYLPFGEEATTAVRPAPLGFQGTDFVTQRFTGKERDAESGLDYFGARYYGSALGRWTSPDWSVSPEPVPYADITDPQTLNLYAYVRNNPLGRVDLGGHNFLETPNQPQEVLDWMKSHPFHCMCYRANIVLPKDPSGLGKEWRHDTGHKNPNGERWVRDDGTKLDFDKAQEGKPGWKGKDHWHVYQPGEKEYDKTQGDRGHLEPGKVAHIPDHLELPEIPVPIPPELKPDLFSVKHGLLFPIFLPGVSGFPGASAPVPATTPTPLFSEPLFAW